jgi:hypothetical protein
MNWRAIPSRDRRRTFSSRPRATIPGRGDGRNRTGQAADPLLQRYVQDVFQEADRLLEVPALRYEIPDGIRLLSVSRACLHRVSTLALAFR